LDGLNDQVIPVEVATQTMQIIVTLPDGQTVKRTVKRLQFPMTAAYVFTDYRSQGQTLPYVIINLGSPPTGKLSLFNLCVALSRSSGCSTIRLLRDFDNNIFKQSHNPFLIAEDERLGRLDESTRSWWMKLISDSDGNSG
jgi:hypothetical protein